MYCNEEIIAINQDCAFSTARPVFIYESGDRMLHIFEKELEGGDTAYAFFNFGEKEDVGRVYFKGKRNVRDVWAKKDLEPAESVCFAMPAHTVKIIRVSNMAINS